LISAPSIEDHPTVLADWLELQAFASKDNQVTIFSLKDLKDITQDREAEDIADFDSETDAIVSRVTSEIHNRMQILGASYPFRTNDAGTLLSLGDPSPIGPAVYIFCLLMSHVSKSPLLENFDLTTEAKIGRNLFQICATLSAAGWCEGPAVSFGWPRLDRTGFAAKLEQTYAAFGDGRSRAAPLPAAPEHIKDGGIDIVAWRPTIDHLPGTVYLLGQVASGHKWKEKTVLKDIGLFHWAWFDIQPTSAAVGAMFVPFCVTDAGDDSADQDFLISKMQFITKEFGNFIYRYRLPHYAARAPAVFAQGNNVEGLAEFGRIREWVNAFRDRLREAEV
jgi:hypothetical protein